MEWKAKWQSKWKWTPQAPFGVILCETVLKCVLLVAILPRRMATEIIAKSHLMAKMVSIRAVLTGSSCKNCSCEVLMVGLTGAFRTGRALEFMLPLCAIPVSLPRFLESSTCLSEFYSFNLTVQCPVTPTSSRNVLHAGLPAVRSASWSDLVYGSRIHDDAPLLLLFMPRMRASKQIAG